ncbi:hypothetical protein GCM10018771_45820 [Streptomyces cellulosae]|nr:hypothetical protein GCM10018771_45820 [Streptomyces cellulosae]
MGVPPARATPSAGESASDDNAAGGTPTPVQGSGGGEGVPDPASPA